MTAPKTLYIHIGMPKTGTTTIQHGLHINEAALQANGVFLPMTGRLSSDNTIVHANVGLQYLTDLPDFHGRYDAASPFSTLIAEIQSQPAPNSIISHEILFTTPPEQIKELRTAIPPNIQPVIIIYIRRHDRYIQSIWSQQIRTSRETYDFATFLDDDDALAPRFTDYDWILAQWEAVFGFEHIRLRLFDEVIRADVPLFQDFLAVCDVPTPEQYQTPASINISPSIKTLEVIRELTKRADLNADDLSQFFEIGRFGEPVLAYAEKAGWDTDKLNLITPELYNRIRDRFAESNARVARRYFDRDVLFPDVFEPRAVTLFDMARDVTYEDFIGIAVTAMEHNTKHMHSAKTFYERAERLQAELDITQAELHTAHQRIAAMDAELRNYRQSPLNRARELSAAALREMRATGPGGLLKRVGQWLRGQRRSVEQHTAE